MFFVGYSNERLDMIDKREQFLKNTFESLGGSEPDFEVNKYSLPSKSNLKKFKGNIFSYLYSMDPYS